MAKLENEFQGKLIAEIKRRFPGIIVLKNDEQYLNGIPDLTLLWQDRWAFLEVKRSLREDYEPLQEYYIKKANDMSFGSMICPENKVLVLDKLEVAWGF